MYKDSVGYGVVTHTKTIVPPQYIAETWRTLESSTPDIVIIIGSDVRIEFSENYLRGVPLASGQYVRIRGKDRRVCYIRHPEYTRRFATRSQLLQLKKSLRAIERLGLCVDFKTLNGFIDTRGKTLEQPDKALRATTPQWTMGGF